jgi:hypothetical protein
LKVNNPLTIIAIFAGLAESLATGVLVLLPAEIQSVFVYFVMAFPLVIVLLFFYILYFKNTVLYAPSDYEDESHYLEANNLKENLNKTINEVFQWLNAHSSSLTPEEINNAKETITNSVESETRPLRERIIDFLSEKPSTIKLISEHVGSARRDVRSILFSMKTKGLVISSKVGNSNELNWILCV